MSVGNQILDYIQSSGISQAFISKRAGISVSKLNLALHGKRKLQMNEYEAICFALDVNSDKFLVPRPITTTERTARADKREAMKKGDNDGTVVS